MEKQCINCENDKKSRCKKLFNKYKQSFSSNPLCIFDAAAEHTIVKTKIIAKYVESWINVCLSGNSFDAVWFIDALSNASKYSNILDTGEVAKTTSAQVGDLFCRYSIKYSAKNLYLSSNEINYLRKEDLENYFLLYQKNENLKCHVSQLDVNCFLDRLISWHKQLKKRHNSIAIILYVDPYNIGSVDPTKLRRFLDKSYSELIYNFFVSDLERNQNVQQRFKDYFNLLVTDERVNTSDSKTVTQLTSQMEELMQNTKLSKFSIPVTMKNEKNRAMYILYFFAHNSKGIEKYKKALTDTIGNKLEYVNSNMNHLLHQGNDFCMSISEYAEKEKMYFECCELLKKTFSNGFCLNDDVGILLLTKTGIDKGRIRDDLIKRLIRENKLKKCGAVKQRQFWDVEYEWSESNE